MPSNGTSANAPAWYTGCAVLRNHVVTPSQLRITPPARWASPICERVIKDCATGNVDPVSRDPRPDIGTPRAIKTVWPPVRRPPLAVPLARVGGCSLAAESPWVPARTARIPRQHDTRRRPCIGWPHHPQRVGAGGNRHGYRE